jgi:hypothetical protein
MRRSACEHPDDGPLSAAVSADTAKRPEKGGAMFDIAMVIFGGALFALFLGYVAVCDLL